MLKVKSSLKLRLLIIIPMLVCIILCFTTIANADVESTQLKDTVSADNKIYDNAKSNSSQLWYKKIKDSDGNNTVYISPDNKGDGYIRDDKALSGTQPWSTDNIYYVVQAGNNGEKLTPTNIRWFTDSASAKSITGLENVDTSNVTVLDSLLRSCASLESIDLSSWNTSKVESMYNVFGGCLSLKTFDFLKNWDVSHTTSLAAFFYNCHCLTNVDCINNWDVSNVSDMNSMFYYCTKLQSINLGNWKPSSKISILGNMFGGCSNLKEVYITNFPAVEYKFVDYMFDGCSSLERIYTNTFNLGDKYASSPMFTGCSSKLVGGKNTVWSADHVNADYANIDDGSDHPGYFTPVTTPPVPEPEKKDGGGAAALSPQTTSAQTGDINFLFVGFLMLSFTAAAVYFVRKKYYLYCS